MSQYRYIIDINQNLKILSINMGWTEYPPPLMWPLVGRNILYCPVCNSLVDSSMTVNCLVDIIMTVFCLVDIIMTVNCIVDIIMTVFCLVDIIMTVFCLVDIIMSVFCLVDVLESNNSPSPCTPTQP